MAPTTVGVVVVNYNGGDLTLRTLRSVLATETRGVSLRVVLVDNASSDDVVARVRAELPAVAVVEAGANRGFAGGCNLGIRALGAVDRVALVNNDARVDRGWLLPLLDALERDHDVGAACPKILLDGEFARLTLSASHRGVELRRVCVDGTDVTNRSRVVSGSDGRAPGPAGQRVERLGRAATLLVPLTDDGPSERGSRLELASARATEVTVACGDATSSVTVGPRGATVGVRLPATGATILNNVGTDLVDGRFGADRGYLEPDDGRYDAPTDVFAWCGAGVLLRGAYLDDVGPFDERLFLYYEDLELSWRGRERGWRYRTVPGSVVRHVHSSTTATGSTLTEYYNGRNHLLVAIRHAPASDACAAVLGYALATMSYVARDLRESARHRRRPRLGDVRTRLRALVSVARLAPSMLLSRRRDRRRTVGAVVRPDPPDR